MLLNQLSDKQNALLNEIAYVNIDFETSKGGTLYDAILKVKPKLAKELKAEGLDHLVVKDYENNNGVDGSGSGFCAIAFEDPKTGGVGMSFRGTEDLPNPFTEDMGDNTLTAGFGVSPQALEAIEFYKNNKNPDGYNYLYGHSKGGELATEVYVYDYKNILGAHVINAQPINPYNLTQDQLDALQSGLFDAIIIDGDIVSSLGIRPYPVRIVQNNGDKDGWFDPHSVSAMEFDEHGYAIIEESPFSKYPSQQWVMEKAQMVIGSFQLGIEGIKVVFNAVVHVGELIIYEIKESVQKFVEYLKHTVDKIKEFARDVKETLKEFIVDVSSKISEWFKLNVNPGYKYATEHPIIKVDTYKLRNYAQRLEKVNRRINSVDRRMDALYSKAGFLDLLSLLQADLLTGESWKINRNVSYLEDTASNFESVERKIINNLR